MEPDDLLETFLSRLAGRTIAFLEARRSEEVARLVERQGGTPYIAPALREVPVEDDTAVRAWVDRLAGGRFDVVIFLTGVGCRALLDWAAAHGQIEAVHAALGRARVVARGPKPVRVLKEHGIRIRAEHSDELVAELDRWNLAGQTVGLQLYGGTTPFLTRLRAGLAAAGVTVAEVFPYRWEGPTDAGPVMDLIDACIAGLIDALAIFSSSHHGARGGAPRSALVEKHGFTTAAQRHKAVTKLSSVSLCLCGASDRLEAPLR